MSAHPAGAVLVMRPMREHDLAQVVAVEQRSYDFPWTLGVFADCLRVGYCCWSATVDDALVGYAVMAVAAGEAHVLNICIDPAYRRRGYGRRLLDHLLELAVGHRSIIVFLEVRPSNLGALALYAEAGFERIAVRRGYYPAHAGREDAWVLGKRFDVEEASLSG